MDLFFRNSLLLAVSIGMAYFHINDPNQTPTYQFCMINEPYISGLEEGQVLIHLEPVYMQKDNGLMVGIDHRFTSFYVINQDHIIVKRLNINWRECINSSSASIQKGIEADDVHVSLYWFCIIFVFLIIIMIRKVLRCKHY